MTPPDSQRTFTAAPKPVPANSSCPKCGSSDLVLNYLRKGEQMPRTSLYSKVTDDKWLMRSDSSFSDYTSLSEHIHAHCRRCQYSYGLRTCDDLSEAISELARKDAIDPKKGDTVHTFEGRRFA